MNWWRPCKDTECDPRPGGLASPIVNHMQRAAGHTQNVAEWIVYYLRGTYVEDDEEPEANDPA